MTKEIATPAMDVRIFKENSGWFVMTDSKMGPYPRELAESLAKGMAFAIRSSGGQARIVFADPEEPEPDDGPDDGDVA